MFPFDNTYARLPDRFYARVRATRVKDPRIVKLNRPLAELLGADVERLASPEGAQVLAGNVVPDGAEPIALAYAGHQFGSFVSQLGDGRAIPRRGGRQGRSATGRPVEGRWADALLARRRRARRPRARAAGVPRERGDGRPRGATTRALAAVTTGEQVYREDAHPGAILTRIAASHIRVGTFQFFAARGDQEAVRILATHALARHYGDSVGTGNDALALLERVIDAQAELVARWLGLGFVHGVMNTDNTAISGETIDYGPCAFLDEYDPGKKFSSIDHGGRYAFGSQPRIALWNMTRLAEALLGLFSDDEKEAVRLATERLDRFRPTFEKAHLRVMRAKLGLAGLAGDDERDRALVEGLLERLATNRVDYTLFFRRLCAAVAEAPPDAGSPPAPASPALTSLFPEEPEAFLSWMESWRRRLALEPQAPAARASAMRRANPAFIPRNHRVEEVLEAAVRRDDFQPFETLLEVLARPYEDQPERAHLAEPPGPGQRDYKTFCGT